MINKQWDNPSGVALLLVAENVFNINRIIFCLETGWSAETLPENIRTAATLSDFKRLAKKVSFRHDY